MDWLLRGIGDWGLKSWFRVNEDDSLLCFHLCYVGLAAVWSLEVSALKFELFLPVAFVQLTVLLGS